MSKRKYEIFNLQLIIVFIRTGEPLQLYIQLSYESSSIVVYNIVVKPHTIDAWRHISWQWKFTKSIIMQCECIRWISTFMHKTRTLSNWRVIQQFGRRTIELECIHHPVWSSVKDAGRCALQTNVCIRFAIHALNGNSNNRNTYFDPKIDNNRWIMCLQIGEAFVNERRNNIDVGKERSRQLSVFRCRDCLTHAS